MLVDSGIIDFYNSETGNSTNLEVFTASYPDPPLRFVQGADVVDNSGTLFFLIAPMVVFMILVGELAREKEKRLRQGLIVVGVGHFTYYLSWVVVIFVYSLIIPLVLILSAYAFSFDVFDQTPFLILFITYFLFTMAMCFLALFIYTLVNTAKGANTASYAFLLVGIVLQMFLSQYPL